MTAKIARRATISSEWIFAYLFTDVAATTFNNLESIKIGGKLNRENEITDYFYGIVAGMAF